MGVGDSLFLLFLVVIVRVQRIKIKALKEETDEICIDGTFIYGNA